MTLKRGSIKEREKVTPLGACPNMKNKHGKREILRNVKTGANHVMTWF